MEAHDLPTNGLSHTPVRNDKKMVIFSSGEKKENDQ